MACENCVTYKFTTEEGLGQVVFIAEDPNGLALELQSLTLFFTDVEGTTTQITVFPEWFSFEAVGELVTVGGLYRITLTLTFDFFAANEAGQGPGLYTGTVCFQRTDGSYTNLCCDYEVCSEGVIDTVIDISPNVVFGAGAWGFGGDPRIIRVGIDGSGAVVIVNEADTVAAFGWTNSIFCLAFDNLEQDVFFVPGSHATDDAVYRCTADGDDLELWYDFADGVQNRYLYSPPEGGKLIVGREDGRIWEFDTTTAPSPVFIGRVNTVDRDVKGITMNAVGDIYAAQVNANPQRISRYIRATLTFTAAFIESAPPDGFDNVSYDRVNDLLVTIDDSNLGSKPIGFNRYDLDGNYVDNISNLSPNDMEVVTLEDESQIVLRCSTRSITRHNYPAFDGETVIYNGGGSTGSLIRICTGRIPID